MIGVMEMSIWVTLELYSPPHGRYIRAWLPETAVMADVPWRRPNAKPFHWRKQNVESQIRLQLAPSLLRCLGISYYGIANSFSAYFLVLLGARACYMHTTSNDISVLIVKVLLTCSTLCTVVRL